MHRECVLRICYKRAVKERAQMHAIRHVLAKKKKITDSFEQQRSKTLKVFFSSFDSNYFTFYFIIYNKRREKSYTQLKMNVLSWSGDRLSEYAN